MKKEIKPKNAIKVKGIAEYVFNREAKRQTLFTITPAGCFYFHEGKKITEKELDQIYPTPDKLEKIGYKGANPDKCKNWVDGVKSY